MYNFTSPTVKEGESVYWDSWGKQGGKKSFGVYAKNLLVITCRSSFSDRRAFLTKTPAFPAERANRKAFVILVWMLLLRETLRYSQVCKNTLDGVSSLTYVTELWLKSEHGSFQECFNAFLKPY